MANRNMVSFRSNLCKINSFYGMKSRYLLYVGIYNTLRERHIFESSFGRIHNYDKICGINEYTFYIPQNNGSKRYPRWALQLSRFFNNYYPDEETLRVWDKQQFIVVAHKPCVMFETLVEEIPSNKRHCAVNTNSTSNTNSSSSINVSSNVEDPNKDVCSVCYEPYSNTNPRISKEDLNCRCTIPSLCEECFKRIKNGINIDCPNHCSKYYISHECETCHYPKCPMCRADVIE